MALLDHHLPAAEAAEALGVSVRTLRRYEREGLRVTLIGGRTLYSEKALQDFIDKRTLDRSARPQRRVRAA